MGELELIIGVVALFIARLGIPLAALVFLGVLVDRWQRHRDAELDDYQKSHSG